MTELIKVRENKKGRKLVMARELHEFLEIGQDFTSWIKRMVAYGFEQNVDYSIITNSSENLKGGRPSKEYVITLEMAKEISMLQRTEKGKQARQYFIECEKKLKQVTTILTEEQKLQLFVMNANTIADAQIASSNLDRYRREQISLLEPKAEKFEQFLDTDNLLTWDNVARNLNVGKNTLLKTLRENNILITHTFKDWKGNTKTGDKHNLPYQKYMKYFDVKFLVKDGIRHPKVLVKADGQVYLQKKLIEFGVIKELERVA